MRRSKLSSIASIGQMAAFAALAAQVSLCVPMAGADSSQPQDGSLPAASPRAPGPGLVPGPSALVRDAEIDKPSEREHDPQNAADEAHADEHKQQNGETPESAEDDQHSEQTPQKATDEAPEQQGKDQAGEATSDEPTQHPDAAEDDQMPPSADALAPFRRPEDQTSAQEQKQQQPAEPPEDLSLQVQPAGAPERPEGKKQPSQENQHGVLGFLEDLGLFQGVTISGSNTVTVQEHAIDGSRNTFQNQRWDTDSIVRRSSLHLEGPVWKEFVFQADISDSGWGSSYSRWVGGYVGDDTAILYGDLNLGLGGNEFLGFRKSTKGWQFDQKLPGNGFMRGFYMSEKGQVHNETFTGNGTSGPYFLTYTPVIRGSEVVKVNEEFMEFGQDYRLDYESGRLSFDPTGGQPRIITSGDTVSVSYQSLGYLDQGPGTLYGARAEFPLLNDRLLVGITTLQEDRGGGAGRRDTVGFQEDIYYGSGTTGPFDTNFRPIIPDGTTVVYKGERQVIDEALVVLVDGVEQIESADYDAYRSIGRIIFRRAVPPTSLVKIRYYYDIKTDTDARRGDQENWGLDLAYRFNDDLNMNMQWARSSGATDDQTGNAFTSALNYSKRDLRVLAEYRSIDPTYSYVESVGFRRREKGINLGAEWQVNDNISISNRYSVLDSESGLSFGYSGYGGGGYDFSRGYSAQAYPLQSDTTTSGLGVQTERNDLSLRLAFDGWPQINYRRNTMSNTGGSTANSDYTTDSVSASYSPSDAKYSASLRFNRTKQRTAAAGDGTDADTSTGSDSDQLQASLNYNPTDKLSFSASYADSSSSSIDTPDTSSSDSVQLNASWSPSPEFGLRISRSMSDSTGRVSSGYYNTYTPSPSPTPGPSPPSGGYYPPGGGGGDDDDHQTVRPAISDTSDRISMYWRPSSRLSLDFSVGARKYSSSGSQGYLADSDQTFWNFSTMWQASDAVSVNMSIASDKMQFLEEDRGAVTNDSFMLSADYRPPGKKWNAGLSLNIQDGSSPTYVGYGRLQRYKMVSTELFDVRGRLSYRISDDLSLQASAGISDFASGYSNFKKTNAELSARYRLSQTTGIDFGYRFIKHISRSDEDSLIFGTSGSGENYIANSLILRVSTNFRGGLGSGRTRQLGMGYGGGGFGTGPRTFGGYEPSLRTGRYGGGFGSSGTRYGTTTYGGSSGFDITGRNRYQTGYGPTEFDRIGSQRTRQTTGGLFDSAPRPFSGTTRPPSEGMETGVGEFRTDRRRDMDIREGPAGPRQPGTGPSTAPSEDWWLLEDNAAYW